MNEHEIFAVAIKLTGQSRQSFLDGVCADSPELRQQIDSLLRAHDESGSFLPKKAVVEPDETRSMQGSPQPGVIISGRYKLLEVIGEGGMGSVWMAEQAAPVKRRVALKLIKPGMDSRQVLARFDAERQALALMDHPNIAKVFDGGLTEQGRPYFVMEYVKGMPLTEYCDQVRMSLQDRLKLFASVCQAVQHAHQKGIIHRDLKPSNILACLYDGQAVPKIIDFGLAKAMHQSLTDQSLFTAHGMMVGTPLYMSPEQAEHNNLDVDTRTDIYSLGVILYELLTGTTPLERIQLKDAAYNEILRLIKEVDPPRPSTRLSGSASLPSVAAQRSIDPAKLSKSLSGDLDWIVMKALDKERNRRYETANGLARDIDRFLSDEPVEACPPTTRYKIRKYVRRNRGKVIAGSLLLLTLVIGIVGTTLGLIEAKRQQRIAQAEVLQKETARKQTREALDTLTSDALEGWFTREQSLTREQTNVLHRLLEQYADFAAEGGGTVDSRQGQVRALVRVGRIQRTLGDRSAAAATLRRATELAGTANSPIAADVDGWDLVTVAQNELARLNQADRSYREAEVHCREALAAQMRILDFDPTHDKARINIAGLRVSLAGALSDLERFEEAEREQVTASAELEKLVTEFPREAVLRENLAVLLYNRALMLNNQGRLPDALALNKRAVVLQRQTAADAPGTLRPQTRLVMSLRQQSELLDKAQRPSEAEGVRREAIRLGFALSESYPSVLEYRINIASDYWTLSHTLTAQGRRGDAADEAGRGLAVMRQVVADFPENHSARADLMTALSISSKSMLGIQKPQEAESAAREALIEGERLATLGFSPDNVCSLQANVMRALANALHDQGRNAEARAATKMQVNLLARLAKDHPERTDYLNNLCQGRIDSAQSLIGQREGEAAIEELHAVFAELDGLTKSDRVQLEPVVSFELAKAFGVIDNWTESEKWAGQAVTVFSERLKQNPEFHQYRGFLTQSHWHRATARDQLGRYAEAAADWGAAADLADEPMDKAFYHAQRGTSLSHSGDADTAAKEFETAVSQAAAVLVANDLAGITYYDGATVYALASGGITNPVAKEAHAVEAVRLLGRAAAVGFLADPAQRKALRAAGAFSALHTRPDFEQFLSALDQDVPSQATPPGALAPKQ